MAVAHDAFSKSSSGTGTLSWTHTPVGTPKGVLVMIVQNVTVADQVSAVTYGGEAMAEISSVSPLLHSLGSEDATLYMYFLGEDIPTGAQTVEVTVSGSATKVAAAVTVTADASTTRYSAAGVNESASSTTPAVTLETSLGRDAVAYGFVHSGHDDISSLTPNASYTRLGSHDFGDKVADWIVRTTNPTNPQFAPQWSALASEYGAGAATIIENPTAPTVSFASDTDEDAEGTGTSVTPTIGQGTGVTATSPPRDGDLVVVRIITRHASSGTTVTPPSSQGWTDFSGGSSFAGGYLSRANLEESIFAKVWGAGHTDDRTPTFTLNTGTNGFLASSFTIAPPSYDNPYVDPLDALYGYATDNDDSAATTMVAPSVSATVDDVLVLRLFASADDNVHGTPSEGTLGAQNVSTAGSDMAYSMSYLNDQDIATSTGTATMEQTTLGADVYLTRTLVIKAPTQPVEPATVAATTTIASPGISPTEEATTIDGVTTFGEPIILSGVIAEPDLIAVVTTLDAPTIVVNATVEPAVITATTTVAPAGLNITIAVGNIAGATTMGAPTLAITGSPAPATVALVSYIPLPQIYGVEPESPTPAQTARWVLLDPETGAEYEFEINPTQQNLDPYGKNLIYRNTTAPERRSVILEANADSRTISWSGMTFTQAQYATFQSWYDVGNPIELTDDLGRQFEIYISEYSPKRTNSPLYPWLHRYEMRAVILSEL